MLPLVNPVTIAAAAVGGLGYAFYAARKVAELQNLILISSTTGLTVDKFNQLTAMRLTGWTVLLAAEQ